MGDYHEPDFKEIFFEDMDRILKEFGENLMSLKTGDKQKEAFKDLHRNVHSIKGLTASMGFENIRKVSEELENLLRNFLNIDVLLKDENTLKEIDSGFQIIKRLVRDEKKDSAG